MQKDIRATCAYRDAEALFRTLRRPGTGQISDATDVHASPDEQAAVFAGTLVDALEGALTTRICRTDLGNGRTEVLTFGPNTDRHPRYSPDGRHIAFLSDRHDSGDFQLYLLDPQSGAARATPVVQGWVEYLHWSPDSGRILLGVAGHGADLSGGEGAVATQQKLGAPSWMPAVESGDESHRWRRLWIYELATHTVREVPHPGHNVWEAVWCGDRELAAVVSPGPGEGSWYGARLCLFDAETGGSRELFQPRDQLGWPAACPSGTKVAVVEAVCSDRWIVAGELNLIDATSGNRQKVSTNGVDVSYVEWRSDTKLLVAGHRGFETVVGVYDTNRLAFSETWCSDDVTTGGRYIRVSGLGQDGDCLLVGENFLRAPEIAWIVNGAYKTVRSFDLGYAEPASAIAAVERVCWPAPDGQEIQGWLLHPRGQKPHPLILYVHGGPVWHWRPMWLGRSAAALLLIKAGYAIFLPNPRGSSGRGLDFARQVLGDMGGGDTNDLLSGIDQLVKRGIADRDRLGVAGGSYGGFMTSWIIAQDARFAAAVSIVPITNHVTWQLVSNIPDCVPLFLADHYRNFGGKYFQRSPIMHAHKVRTPTLNICGALDRVTPAAEAVQFHNALLENGAKSVLVTYPEEGHGVRTFPAAIDYAARLVLWFDEHLRIDRNSEGSAAHEDE